VRVRVVCGVCVRVRVVCGVWGGVWGGGCVGGGVWGGWGVGGGGGWQQWWWWQWWSSGFRCHYTNTEDLPLVSSLFYSKSLVPFAQNKTRAKLKL